MTLTYHNVRVKVGAEIVREVVSIVSHDDATPAHRNDLAAFHGVQIVAKRFGLERFGVRLVSATRVRGIKPVQL